MRVWTCVVVCLVAAPLAGVTIEAHGSDGALLATLAGADGGTGTTASDGSFSLTIPITSSPTGGWLAFSGATIPKTRLYTSWNLLTFGLKVNIPTTSQVMAAYALVNTTYDATRGTIAVHVSRCGGGSVMGATVEASPAPSTTAYTDTSSPLPSTTATRTAKNGLAFLLGEPAGAATVTAIDGAQTFPPLPVTVEAAGLTIAIIAP